MEAPSSAAFCSSSDSSFFGMSFALRSAGDMDSDFSSSSCHSVFFKFLCNVCNSFSFSLSVSLIV
jgi:hypothetical protein